MSRWNNFVDRVDEKVTKKEIDDALKNPNVLIGAEFEFKVEDGLENSGGIQDEYNRAMQDVESYNRDVKRYEEEIYDYDKESHEMEQKLEKVKDSYDKLYDELTDYENEETNVEVDLDSLKDSKKTLERERDGYVKDLRQEKDPVEKKALSIEITSINDKIKNISVDIAKTEKKLSSVRNDIKTWTKRTDKLQKEIDDLEDEIKNREDYRYEEIEVPYLNKQQHSDYFDYMTNWIGYSERDLYVEPGEMADFPPEWEGGGGDFVESVENSGILDSAPFSDYELGEYGNFSPKPGSRTWAVESDQSLGEDGVEVKSPPMPVPKFIKEALPEMFDWINKIGYTDSDCGFHCHMSLPNSSRGIDYIKLIMFTDEEWIYKAFSERAGSYYAKSMRNKMSDSNPINQNDIKNLFDKSSLVLKSKMAKEHYDGISLIDEREGHVEFRYMGGRDYHKKLKEIIALIGSFAYTLSMSADPEFKKKEYLHKLHRVMNRMDLYTIEVREEMVYFALNDMKELTDTDKKVLTKLYNETKAYKTKLASSFKMDNRTRTSMANNRAFHQGAVTDALKLILVNISPAAQAEFKRSYPGTLKI